MYCIVYDESTGTENGFDAMEGDAWHYLRLGLAPHDKEAPKKVSGSFRLWDKIGTFGALVRDEGETVNYWYIADVEWSEVPEDDDHPVGGGVVEVEEDAIERRQRFRHGITVLKTLDDRRHPFIELIYNMVPGKTGGGARMVKTLGKKQKNDKGSFGLTSDEAERLMEDGVVDELEGLGWQASSDRDSDDENGQDKWGVDHCGDVVAGVKRKAEEQADDSERCPAGRKD